MKILLLGKNGQVGWELQRSLAPLGELLALDRNSTTHCGDLSNLEGLAETVRVYRPDVVVNAAAYTAVDKAESEPAKAFDINANGAENLAITSKKHHTILIHISTDFVFDAYFSEGVAYYDREFRLPLKSNLGLTETDIPFPSGVYGLTKLQGEQAIQAIWEKHFIIRTSWVYSQFGNNFMKTMLRLASERDSLSVVSDQIGTPTNAVDLAEVLIKIIQSSNYQSSFGIYNFSNEGQCSWYDFANEIFRQKGVSIYLKTIPTSAYPTPAKRPAYSVLDKTKIKSTFDIKINDWQTSLSACLKQL
jgi:dTDP-4-dehydrorhamnose reductase